MSLAQTTYSDSYPLGVRRNPWPEADLYPILPPPAGAGWCRDRERQSPENPSPIGQGPRAPHCPILVEEALPRTAVDQRLVQAAAGIQRAEARIVDAAATFLAVLHDRRSHEKLDFSSFSDMSREALGMDPRTARNRVALGKLLSSKPSIRQAFLDGKVSACQLLVLRPVMTDDNEAFWLEQCSRLTVRELTRRVREARKVNGVMNEEPDEDASTASVSFEAPPAVWVAWDLAMETARKMLGWEAPIYKCVEAVLAEAAPGGFPDECNKAPAPGGSRSGTVVHSENRPEEARSWSAADLVPATPIASRSLRRARTTLEQVADVLEDIDDLIDVSPAASPRLLIARVQSLQAIERPLRVLLGRVLRDLVATGAIYRLGYLRVAEFVEDRLHVSQRTGRTLVRECEIYSDCPALEEAVAIGRIGLRQAILIHRFSPRDAIDAFIARAADVFCRQFVREMRLVEKLQDLGLFRFAGPLPAHDLEKALFRELAGRGWTSAELDSKLRQLGLKRPDDSSPDPAVNRILMLRLEFLVDLLLLVSRDDAESRFDDVAAPGGWQPFAATDSAADDNGVAGQFRPVKRLGFTGPEPVVRHLRAAIGEIREAHGSVPTWFCVLTLLREALAAWNEHDPDTTPTQVRILERDGYLCQVPGCSSRRNLEVHHVQFRSQGGANQKDNLITMCHAHHAHMLHKGGLRVTGAAPHDLRWEMGRAGGSAPLWVLHGERVVARG